MSVKIMSLVWERAPYTAGTLLVLLALADWSNEEGISWPSMERLARKTRIDKRSAQRIVRQLAKDGIIQIDEGGGRGKQHRYLIQIETVTNCHPLEKCDIQSTETVTFETQRVTSEAETVTPMSSDPLEEPLAKPLGDPSGENGRATRLSKNFALNSEMQTWAKENTPHVDLDAALAEFVDYWIAVAGAAGRKLNWVATWRNRMRVLQDRARRNGNGTNKPGHGYETASEKRARGFSRKLAIIADLRGEGGGDHNEGECGEPVNARRSGV